MQTVNAKSLTEFPDAPDIESSTLDYAGRFSGPIGEWLAQRQVTATRKALKQIIDSNKPFTVLDVGGGHGQNIEIVNELGGELTIVGSHNSCSCVIKDRVANGQARFEIAPLLHLPFKDQSFDVVLCYRILSHMASWEALIAELGRVSKQLVLIDYPTKKSINIVANTLFSIKKRIEKNTRPYGCFSDQEVDQVFARSDLHKVFDHRQFFLPMALYRLIRNVPVATTLAGTFRKTGLTDRFGSPVISGYSRHPS